MIQVIDRISYLPRKNKKTLLDTNEIYNEVYKKIVNDIRRKVNKIPTGGKKAIITIKGRASQHNQNIDINIDCENEDLLNKIQSTLNK